MIYEYSGHLGVPISVNDQFSGATVAILTPEGAIHPDYTENPLTLQWIEDVPDWDSVIADLPVPEPEPQEPNWLGFYQALLVSAPYNHARSQAKLHTNVNLPYTDLAGNLTAAIAGNPNPSGFEFTYTELLTELDAVGAPLSPEAIAEVQSMAEQFNLPLTL